MAPSSSTDSIRVLIADDHEIVREGLSSLFQDSEIRVVGAAADVAEAVKLSRKLKPDVVVLDVRMGADDGIEAIRKSVTPRPARGS
jgi:DNA-binding NarL/FixJ family response regulator